MAPIGTHVVQSLFLFAVIANDYLFCYNIYDYHHVNKHQVGHDVLYRPFYPVQLPKAINETLSLPNIDNLRNATTESLLALVLHIATGTLPLLLSVFQVSVFMRSTFGLGVHRWAGRVCLISAAASAPFALYLSFKVVGVAWWVHWSIVILSCLWMISIVATWWYARAQTRNIALHRQWAVRFATYTHVIPLLARLVIIILWLMSGAPKWSISKDGAAHPAGGYQLFETMVAIIFVILLPFTEVMVWLEKPKAVVVKKTQ